MTKTGTCKLFTQKLDTLPKNMRFREPWPWEDTTSIDGGDFVTSSFMTDWGLPVRYLTEKFIYNYLYNNQQERSW